MKSELNDRGIFSSSSGPNIWLKVKVKDARLVSSTIDYCQNNHFKCSVEGSANKRIDDLLIKWCDDYTSKRNTKINLPFGNNAGGSYQQRVYQELSKTNFGETITYQDLARFAGNDRACRAVGNACSKNSYVLLVPCHRVVPKMGGIGNFSCGQSFKSLLLTFEGSMSGN